MSIRLSTLVAIGAVAATTLSASAAIVTHNFVFLANGLRNGQSFTNRSVVVTAQYNTANATTSGSIWSVNHSGFATVNIDGIGSATMNQATRSFTNSAGSYGNAMGFGPVGGDYFAFTIPVGTDVASADVLSTILYSQGTMYFSGGGYIEAVSGSSIRFVTGTYVPAPGAVALLGLAGLTARRRR